MESRKGIMLAVLVMAVMLSVPLGSFDAVDSDDFTYQSQLDKNGVLVYQQIGKAESVNETTKEFVVEFVINDNVFNDQEEAKRYGDSTVQEALAAEYLTNPMIPYLWNYPVQEVAVEVEVKPVTIIDLETGKETNMYSVSKVSFTLSVPEGITSESIKTLNDALKEVPVNGDTDADKVTSIMAYLDKLNFQKDEEGKISNIYNALVDKKTTSAGVAQAFTQLCVLNHIHAIIVAGDNVMTSQEDKSFWNYVYLEGEIEGKTASAWYIVDPTYAVSAGIAGYLTQVEANGHIYSMSAAHYTDLDLSAPNDLSVPQLTKDKYVRVGGPSFLEMYGEKILIIVLGAVVILAIVYAVRTGNI
jgi:hypothetical protein